LSSLNSPQAPGRVVLSRVTKVAAGTAISRLRQPPRTVAPRRFTTWIRLVPLVFFLTFLNLTVAVFFLGPWPFQLANPTKLIVFLAAAHVALGLGYLSAAFKAPRGFNRTWRVEGIAGWSLLVSLAVLLPTTLFRTGSLFPSITDALSNPGQVYTASLQTRALVTPIIEYVRFFVGPLIGMLLPLTVFYWRRLNLLVKIGGVINIVGILLTFIAMGTNKAIADTLAVIPWLLLAGHLSGTLRLGFKRRTAIACTAVCATVLFLAFYTATQNSRAGSTAKFGYVRSAGVWADRDNVMIRNLPETAQVGVLGLTGYLSHGYYALYLALDKPFVPMFGVGNSFFLFRQAARLLDRPSIMDMPYPLRVQAADGWDAYGLWGTIYPWIASDVSFPGTILIVFAIGRLFALTWLDTLRGENPFAVVMFAQFLIMLFYFSANNQCLQDGEGVATFWSTLLIWYCTRRTSGGPLRRGITILSRVG
jgi:hypothetical protein